MSDHKIVIKHKVTGKYYTLGTTNYAELNAWMTTASRKLYIKCVTDYGSPRVHDYIKNNYTVESTIPCEVLSNFPFNEYLEIQRYLESSKEYIIIYGNHE